MARRLFIGITLPDEAVDALVADQAALSPHLKTGRASSRENLHLTLIFLGEVDEDRLDVDRTTYDQITDGIPVARSQVQPGDLVFPHAGHVQMAIGNGLVVEAPYSGATVRISRLGDNIAIRRPVA